MLAGGNGTRLWPVSRKSHPKQFSNFIGELSLFQNSANRLKNSGVIEFHQPITVTNERFRFVVSEQLLEIGVEPGPILLEPDTKNTAAAILLASLFAHSSDEESILLVSPSDHVIDDILSFHKAIEEGIGHAKDQKIVTFGIKPSHPETGYGYLELPITTENDSGALEVVSFIEKPDLELSMRLVAQDNYLWNSGVFLFRAKDLIDAFHLHDPETLKLVSELQNGAETDLGFLRFDAHAWAKLPNISIDYAIMEKIRNLVAVPCDFSWSDLGGWKAVWEQQEKDKSGNVYSNSAQQIDCSNSLLLSEGDGPQIVGIGLQDIITVATSDAVLVVNRDRSQDVKLAVQMLKEKNIPQAETYPKDYRPWGWFESLTSGCGFQVKRICVKVGGILSLQSHEHRSEHWVVVSGTAKVTIDNEVTILDEGQSIYVPLGAVHRLENPGSVPTVIIEIQIGDYLGEDDIVRYEDRYHRNQVSAS